MSQCRGGREQVKPRRLLFLYGAKRNANVCSDPVQSHYDEKFMNDNRSTSQNEIRAKCYLDIYLSNCTVWYSLYTFLHTPPVSKTANVKAWLTFIQSNTTNLICDYFAVQYISHHDHGLFVRIQVYYSKCVSNTMVILALTKLSSILPKC